MDERVLVPETSEPYHWTLEVEWVSTQASLILPQPDCDVAALSLYRERFWHKLVLPSETTVIVGQDKLSTHFRLKGAGVQSVETWPLAQRHAIVDRTGYPVWLRARSGAGGRGSFKAYTPEQIEAWVDYCEETGRVERDEFVVCEYLPGREFACQQLWWEGKLIVSQARERLQYLMGYLSPTGQTSSPSVARTVRDGRVDNLATVAVQAVTLQAPHGIFGVDMKEDSLKRLCVTEVNVGRFFTTSLFLAEAGLNIPQLLLSLHSGNVVEPLGRSPLRPDLYWIRVVDRSPRLVAKSVIEKLAKGPQKVAV